MPEIIILAMVFLFVALRLWSVLGKRTGHEHPVAKPVEAPARPAPIALPEAGVQPVGSAGPDLSIAPSAMAGVRAITDADRSFDAAHFIDGARSAYRMILEAFWAGDEAALAPLVGDDVRAAFAAAIAERKALGHVLDNRLIGIEQAEIEQARIEGVSALVTLRFNADIAAVTRDAAGEVVAGSMSDAIQTHDVWTFSRELGSDDPNWHLVDTDEAA